MARKPRMMAANQTFWSGDTCIPIGAIYAEDHPEVKGREAFFSEVVPAPSPEPAAPPAASAPSSAQAAAKAK